MKIIVQKFGGTSVRDEQSRLSALVHVQRAVREGYKVVVVVSAMGRKGDPYATDTLLSLAGSGGGALTKRETDLLLSTGELISTLVFSAMLKENGLKAVALTGGQAGFMTDHDHMNAKIIEMKPARLLNELETSDVAVVAGFQGMSKSGEVTTLGRGGSDTSAAALGAALQAEFIDIFTDVNGIMTADPRIAQNARPLSVVTYTEVCNMAYQGAKVIHPRAVEIAMQSKVPLRIRSTYTDETGTLVTSSPDDNRGSDARDRLVTGIAHVTGITRIRVQTNEQAHIFQLMAGEGISVDFINISEDRVTYTVRDGDADKAKKRLEESGYTPILEPDCAKVSVVGAGMTGVPGVTSKIVSALAACGINIMQSADSHTTIWVLVKEEQMPAAVNALHDAFLLPQINE
ncbi:aspartate kinase [Domibacillus enclensis]|uniref:Aspartokinase n=1 Tax=Domibacillus enclensis TaxID=1017273 RepID=A0A1N6UR43_9BACI|nr:aspartate kinase [Domibacillus enclensis]OXS78598.1 aspartate kinase [Domibacillus enclensis]SIQ68079.1 aspartate kinase [Domibacillus enclensis]